MLKCHLVPFEMLKDTWGIQMGLAAKTSDREIQKCCSGMRPGCQMAYPRASQLLLHAYTCITERRMQ